MTKAHDGTAIIENSNERQLLLPINDERSEKSLGSYTNKKKPSLGFWKFVFLSYFCACGGPYGMEVAVASGYPMLALLAILIIPWFWSLPLGLLAAELSTSLNSNDGFVLWIKVAFGPFAGYMTGCLSWVNSVIDNALYPSLFYSYLVTVLKHYIPDFDTHWCSFLVQFIFIFLLMLFNLLGVDFIGSLSGIFFGIVVGPFVLMLFWGLPTDHVHPKDWLIRPPEISMSSLGPVVNIMLWSYAGYDYMGLIAEEVKEPSKNFPRAIVVVIFLTISTYFVSLISTLSLDTTYSHWGEGYFADLAAMLGGEYLRIFMIIGGMISAIGIYNAILCTSAQELRAMGEPEMFNSRLLRYRHPRFNTPWTAIAVNSLLTALCCFLPFDQLLNLNNCIYSLILLMEYFSLIRLRYTHPEIKRPFRISQNNLWTILLCIPPCLLCVYVIVSNFIESWLSGVVAGAIIIFFMSSYAILKMLRRPTQ